MTPPEQSYCEIPLSKGLVTRVSSHRFQENRYLGWYASINTMGTYYAVRHVETANGDRLELLHRRILGLGYGDLLEGDHKDRDTLNNTDENLRIATRSQQQHNQGPRKHNRSGYKGVSYNSRMGRWIAQIRNNWKRIHLGTFDTAEEAAIAYNVAAKSLHGEFAYINHVGRPPSQI